MRGRSTFFIRDWYVISFIFILYCSNYPCDHLISSMIQVCKRFKVIIDLSTELQLLIELYHDNLHPNPYFITEINRNDGVIGYNTVTPTQGFHDLLQSQIQWRRRWENFSPRLVTRVPVYGQARIWNNCKINNGYLAYCSKNIDNMIIFKDLRNPANNEADITIKMHCPCVGFAFDLSQDLLITLHKDQTQRFVQKSDRNTPYSFLPYVF